VGPTASLVVWPLTKIHSQARLTRCLVVNAVRAVPAACSKVKGLCVYISAIGRNVEDSSFPELPATEMCRYSHLPNK